MFRMGIRLLNKLNRSAYGLIRILEWAAPNNFLVAFLIVIIKAILGIIPSIRWFTLLMIEKPHLFAGLFTGWTIHLYFGVVVFAIGEIAQALVIPFNHWGKGWMFKRTFPSRYHEVVQRKFPGTVDEKRNRFIAPLIGWPQIHSDRVDFTVVPGVGRALGDLEVMTVSLAAQYKSVNKIDIKPETSSSHKGLLSINLRDATNKVENGPVPVDA